MHDHKLGQFATSATPIMSERLIRVQRRLLFVILGSCLITSTALPAHAQMAQSGMMAYSLIRTVPMMGNMLVRGILPHSGQNQNKKNNNANNNNTNNNSNNVNGQMQAQPYLGTAPTGFPMGNAQPGYPNMQGQGFPAPYGQPGYGMQGQAFAAPTAQQGYGAVPGLSYAAPTMQGNGNVQNAYGNVQGQLYGAQNGQPSAAAVPGLEAGGTYGPSAGQ
jgi:hypothetical protein